MHVGLSVHINEIGVPDILNITNLIFLLTDENDVFLTDESGVFLTT